MSVALLSPLIARHRVKSYELDSFGHVNNAVYLNLFEGARNEYMLQRGLSFSDFSTWKAHPIVAEAWVRFRRPAFVDDVLIIHGSVENASAVSFTILYRIERESDGQCLSDGSTRMAFVDSSGKPTRIPQAFKEKFIESRDLSSL
jgi:acyl-CoA thioester hydrolase